jgi:phosphatidylglycerophosphate synthase
MPNSSIAPSPSVSQDDPHLPERRPIASRERRWSKAVAHWLASRGFSPNAISTAGMVAGMVAGLSLAATRWPAWTTAGFVLGAVGIQLRLLANMFDGMVAIETGRTSAVGELYNEVPDRVSDTAILVGAGYSAGGCPVLGYVAALLAVFIAYVRAQGRVAGAPQEYCGPMAKPQRMFVMTVGALAAALLPSAWMPRVPALPEQGIMAAALMLIIAGETVTVHRRLVRIAAALHKGHS